MPPTGYNRNCTRHTFFIWHGENILELWQNISRQKYYQNFQVCAFTVFSLWICSLCRFSDVHTFWRKVAVFYIYRFRLEQTRKQNYTISTSVILNGGKYIWYWIKYKKIEALSEFSGMYVDRTLLENMFFMLISDRGMLWLKVITFYIYRLWLEQHTIGIIQETYPLFWMWLSIFKIEQNISR